MTNDCHVAVIGAGPYGLATTAQLRRRGVDVRILGEPMSFWRTMPAGMLLRSNRSATNMIELHGEFSLSAFERDTGTTVTVPVPLDVFVAYGDWVQPRVAPDVERKRVETLASDGGGFVLECSDGEEIRAERVVVACGIAPFARRPAPFDTLPHELASHSADHRDFSRFAGKRVVVVGGGQSALESAALLSETGAGVTVVARASRLVWLRGVGVKRRLRKLGPVVYAPTDVGPLWYSRLVSVPDLFRQVPRRAQDRIAARCVRPAGAHWVRSRLDDVRIELGRSIATVREVGEELEVRLDDSTVLRADHVVLGTGYEVDLRRYELLSAPLLDRVWLRSGYPELAPGFESSVPGLHFLGAPAAWSFGPTMRFVSGSWYAARAVATHVAETDGARSRPPRRAPAPVPGD